MITLKLTDKQYHTLVEILEREFDAELKYQEESQEPDTQLLEDYVDVYDVLEDAPVNNIVSCIVANDLKVTRHQQIKDLKERRNETL